MRGACLAGALALGACERAGATGTPAGGVSGVPSAGASARLGGAHEAPSDASLVASMRPAKLRSVLRLLSTAHPVLAALGADRGVRAALGLLTADERLAASARAALIVRPDGSALAVLPEESGVPSLHHAGDARTYLEAAVVAPWEAASSLEARGSAAGLRAVVGDALGVANETESWSATVRDEGPRARVEVRVKLAPRGPLARWVEQAGEPAADVPQTLALLPAGLVAAGALASHALTAPWFNELGGVASALGGEAPTTRLGQAGEGAVGVGLAWAGEGPTLLTRRAVAGSSAEALGQLRSALESLRSPSFALRLDRTRASGVSADVLRLRVEDRRPGPKSAGAPRALALAITAWRGWLLGAAGHAPLDGVRALALGEERLGDPLAARAASLCDGTPLAVGLLSPPPAGWGDPTASSEASPLLLCLWASAPARTLALSVDVALRR